MQCQHVTKYRRARMKKAKASERGWMDVQCSEVGFTKKVLTNKYKHIHLTSNEALCVMEVVNHLYQPLISVQCRYDKRDVCLSRCLLSRPSFPPSIHPSICPQVAYKLDNLVSSHQRCPQLNKNLEEWCCYCYDYCYWHYNWLLSAMIYMKSLYS